MITQPMGGSVSAYAALSLAVKRKESASAASADATTVSISDRAKLALAADTRRSSVEESAIQRRLSVIEAKPVMERTSEEIQFVLANDKRLAEINSKPPELRTADDLDYGQKACGFVNTMAYLSDGEKRLYDEMVAKGDWDAVRGMNLIALCRTGLDGQSVTLPDGTSFYPTSTSITAENVRKLFSHMVVDSSGDAKQAFDALAAYLEKRGSSAGKV